SVGEAMAIGRTFQESLQKALRSLETGLTGLNEVGIPGHEPGGQHDDNENAVYTAIATPTPLRLLHVAEAMRLGYALEDIHDSCRIDMWFLEQLKGIVDTEQQVRDLGLPDDAQALRGLKAM